MSPRYTILFVLFYCFLAPQPIEAQTQTPEQIQLQAQMEEFKNAAKPITDRIVKQNMLIHGTACDVLAETQRQNVSKRILNRVSAINLQNFDFKAYSNDMIALLTELRDVPGELCNSYEGLQCNSTGACGCGDGGALGINMKFVREKTKCVIAGGSICASDDVLNKKNPLLDGIPKTSYQCSASARCMVKSTGKACSEANMKVEFDKIFKNEKEKANLVDFILKKVNEGICVCKATTSTVSIFLVIASSLGVAIRSYL